MSKIAIISQPDRGVLIDLAGCLSLMEATHHLTSTLQLSSDFWNGNDVDLNLGQLELTKEEVAQILAIAAEVGVKPRQVYACADHTRAALEANAVKIGEGVPMKLPEAASEAQNLPVDNQSPAAIALAPAVRDPLHTDAAAAELEESSSTGTEAVSCLEDAPFVVPSGVTVAAEEPGAPSPQPTVLYLRQTLRSGQAVSHQGHLVIVGDVNPGAEVMAEGDITVWGALRGMAHAGIGGNSRAEIRALRLQPVQLRIAQAIARSPDSPRTSAPPRSGPETARIVNGTIRITAHNLD